MSWKIYGTVYDVASFFLKGSRVIQVINIKNSSMYAVRFTADFSISSR